MGRVITRFTKVNSPHPRLRVGGGAQGRMSRAEAKRGGAKRNKKGTLCLARVGSCRGGVLVLVRFLLCFVVWFGWLFLVCGALRGLCLVPGLVRLLDLILVGGSSGKRRIGSGRIDASSHQHVVRSARGSAGARKGSRLAVIGSSSPTLVPGPNSLKTTRGGKVRGRPWASAHLSLRAEVRIKGISHHFLGACVCVCVSVGPSNK